MQKGRPVTNQILETCVAMAKDGTTPAEMEIYLADKVPKDEIEGLVADVRSCILAPYLCKDGCYRLPNGTVLRPA